MLGLIFKTSSSWCDINDQMWPYDEQRSRLFGLRSIVRYGKLEALRRKPAGRVSVGARAFHDYSRVIAMASKYELERKESVQHE